MPRSCRTRSPSGSVGPFAPSATRRQRRVGAVSTVIWFSRAAGTKMSAFVARKAAWSITFPLP